LKKFLLAFLIGCGPAHAIDATPRAPVAEISRAPEDVTPKQDLRLLPPEAYVRSYLNLFGGLGPKEVQDRARGADGGQLFDTWDDYLAALGFPDYKLDLPRATQTNAIMVATFERLAVALCDRAVERDLKSNPPLPVDQRVVFAFEVPATTMNEGEFAARFDVLHRTFLGYPAALAPKRTEEFFGLYKKVESLHAAAKKTRFTPAQAGWSAVCQGLARHPEFHLY
jgi:hypothetical protein